MITDRGEQVMNFSTDSLQSLLCTARRYMAEAKGDNEGKMFSGYKIGRSGDKRVIELSANAGDIVEYVDGWIGVFGVTTRSRSRSLSLLPDQIDRLPRGGGSDDHQYLQPEARVHSPRPGVVLQGGCGPREALRSDPGAQEEGRQSGIGSRCYNRVTSLLEGA